MCEGWSLFNMFLNLKKLDTSVHLEKMMGPAVFAWPFASAQVHVPHPAPWPSLRPYSLPKRRWEWGFARASRQKLVRGYSKGAVQVNSERAESMGSKKLRNIPEVWHKCAYSMATPLAWLSPPGATGTGAVVHSQISTCEARASELVEHPLSPCRL